MDGDQLDSVVSVSVIELLRLPFPLNDPLKGRDILFGSDSCKRFKAAERTKSVTSRF